MAVCRVCESSFEPFISFGQMPIANGFLTDEQFKDEYFFELAVGFCHHCTMVQLIDQPEREMMFNDHYAFYSSTSKHMADHFRLFAQWVQQEYLTEKDPLVIEIGSNDGIMLQHFADKKIRHVGFEPSANVAQVAQQKGITTFVRFFDQDAATDLKNKYGKADVVLGANVVCHIPYLHSVAQGIQEVLKPNGVFIFEEPYLGDIVEKTSYDQIYDEHVFFFSLSSITALFGQHGLEIIQVMPQPVHGGSMRYVLAHTGAYPIHESVTKQRAYEDKLQLRQPATFQKLRQAIEKSRDDLKQLLTDLKSQRKRVVGYGATSKSTTIINYCEIIPDLVEFISDTTPIKQGKYSPGMHIPVRPYEDFTKHYPDYALLFAWNHMQEIRAKETTYEAQGGKWIVHVPQVGIVN